MGISRGIANIVTLGAVSKVDAAAESYRRTVGGQGITVANLFAVKHTYLPQYSISILLMKLTIWKWNNYLSQKINLFL